MRGGDRQCLFTLWVLLASSSCKANVIEENIDLEGIPFEGREDKRVIEEGMMNSDIKGWERKFEKLERDIDREREQNRSLGWVNG